MADFKASKNENLAESRASENEQEEEEMLELSLGLSLNGKFGLDPKSKNLQRSYSVTNLRTPIVEQTPALSWRGVPLARTCSLPVEAEEESMKRREIQTLRRREAKRRRVEKMRSYEVGGEVQRMGCVPPPLSQGSSNSGSSSGFSEFNCQTPPLLGRKKNAEAKSPQSVHSEQKEHRSLPAKLSSEMDNVTGISDLKPSRSISATNEMVRNVLADMPCVSTKGHGPDGKRIEGFLYRYSKGEELRIVCVCHGSFLTPAEFVKHAGGEDVEHPLRHIVVYSSSFL